MKRSLVLLLVVALLAMMIPGMALAEDVKFTITGTFAKKLDGTEASIGQYVSPRSPTYDQVTATVTGLNQDYCYVEWTSSDRNVVMVGDNSRVYYDLTDPDVEILPDIQLEGRGTATITGKLFKNFADVKPTATGTFTVALTEIPMTGFSFMSEGKEITEISMVVGEQSVALYSYMKVQPDDGTVTYATAECFAWSINDATVATVTKWGEVKAVKAGTAVVTATSRYYPDLPAKQVTVKVEEVPGETSSKVAFSKVEFSSDKFTLGGGSLSLGDYLTTLPAVCDDRIKWIVSDPSIADVEDDGEFSFLNNAKDGDQVTVTAQSVLGKEHADATITFEEAKPYEKLHFVKKSFELTADNDYMNLYSFVNVDEPENPEDGYIFTSSNPETIGIFEGKYLKLYKPDTVTITVRSKRNPDKAFDTCKVTYKATALKTIWFTSDVPTQMTQGDCFNLWDYINTDPYYYAHSLDGDTTYRGNIKFQAVSDPQIVYFDQDEDGAYVFGRYPGKTTIVAVYDDGKNHIESKPFTIEVVPVPVTEIVFAKKGKFEIKQGKTITLSVGKYLTLKPYNAVLFDDNVTWTTSDAEIVSLDGCKATGVKAGTATVTMSIRNTDGSLVEKSCKITVKNTALESIQFENSGKADYFIVKLPNGGNYKNLQLKVTPADADFRTEDLYVESSDPEVATASICSDSDGYYCRVQAMKPGVTTFTITSRENAKINAKAKVTVKPIQIKSVKFQKAVESNSKKVLIPLYEVEAGSEYERQNEFKVDANVEPSDAYCEYKWETSDASVAFVAQGESGFKSNAYVGSDSTNSKSVRIVAVGPGTCNIRLTVTDGTNTKIRTIKVTVKAAKVFKLALNKTAATVYLIKDGDNTLQLEAYDSKTNYAVPVTWTTANKTIATVDRFGMVTFKKAGKVKLTATTKDGNNTKKTCTLTIKQLNVTSVVPASKTLTMKTGDTATLKVTVKPAKAYNPAVSFKSSKPAIVSVDAEGNLKALKTGKAVITITAKDGSKKSAKVTITVQAAAKNNDIASSEIADNGAGLTIEGFEMDGITDISGTGIDGEINLTIE